MKKHGFNITVIIMSTFLSVLMLFYFIAPKEEKVFGKDVDKTRALLTLQEKEDINKVEEKINLKQRSLALINKQASDDLPYRFSDYMILGDSIVEGLLSYGIFDTTICIGKRGARIDTIDDEINALVQKAPKGIFLAYGLNDIGYWRGDANRFSAVYEEKIKKLKSMLPNTKLYINAILPMAESAIAKNPLYANYIDFNKELERLCKKYDCIYIDNHYILDQLSEKYEFDGIHPRYRYYALWANNMANIAGL
ncbi:MAG: GDSL family lipase [Erysipelotrichia bacterium]|nr:GDSL family lipase [Erysipelotrichia bacterium]